MSENFAISASRANPLGATFDGEGVNFAVFSAHATLIELCLFSDDGKREIARLSLPERDGDIWHGYVAGLRPGQLYGYRVHGPYEPEDGHRFNPNKLLLDPYAKRVVGQVRWHNALMGYDTRSKKKDLSFDSRDSAPYMPKASVEAPDFDFVTSEDVRDELVEALGGAAPDNAYSGTRSIPRPNGEDAPDQDIDLSIYSVDAMVRRATALQLTAEAQRAREEGDVT